MNTDASIETILDVIKHPNADRLDIATVLGYNCITSRDEYKPGDTVIYIRPDTLLPDADWAINYKKYAPKRVKPVKLRDVWSEGIIVPFNTFKEIAAAKGLDVNHKVADIDVAGILEIKHYEAPIAYNVEAKSASLPYFIPKTDEERWENMVKDLPLGEPVDVTLKIDGQSCTIYYKIDEDVVGITSRMQDLKPDADNQFTAVFSKYNLDETLRNYGKAHGISLAIRGEIYGPKIQAMGQNAHATKPLDIAIFSVYLIDERRYTNKGEPDYYTNVAAALGLPIVPMLEEDVLLTWGLIHKYSRNISEINGDPFEGVVLKYAKGSFKIINKSYDAGK